MRGETAHRAEQPKINVFLRGARKHLFETLPVVRTHVAQLKPLAVWEPDGVLTVGPSDRLVHELGLVVTFVLA